MTVEKCIKIIGAWPIVSTNNNNNNNTTGDSKVGAKKILVYINKYIHVYYIHNIDT